MYLPSQVEINEQGHLVIENVDLVECAKQFGTPLFVYNESLIRQKCREYVNTLAKFYPQGDIAFAGKSFLTLAMCRLLMQEKLSLDVVSAGELYVAYKAGFPLDRVYFHGNNKSSDELLMAINLGVGRIVVDNLVELKQICDLALSEKKKVSILLRIKPGINVQTHKFIETGQEDSKFGLSIDDDQLMNTVKEIITSDYVHLCGIHCHLGSQIMSIEPYMMAGRVMVSLMEKIRRETGLTLGELNLGGGLGIPYTKDDKGHSIAEFVKTVCNAVLAAAKDNDYPLPKLILEPGRSIVAEAGLTLYTVGGVKIIPAIRCYIMIDGGMSDNLRVALYGAHYEAVLANRVNEENLDFVTVAGKLCESGDILIKDILLPSPQRGDILAVFNTGAYNFSMFSHYNRNLRPAVVFLKGGSASIVSRREPLEELVRLEEIPDYFC